MLSASDWPAMMQIWFRFSAEISGFPGQQKKLLDGNKENLVELKSQAFMKNAL